MIQIKKSSSELSLGLGYVSILIRIQPALSSKLLTSFPDPLIGHPLPAEQNRTGRVNSHPVSGSVLPKKIIFSVSTIIILTKTSRKSGQ
jgi:hypothetical protein